MKKSISSRSFALLAIVMALFVASVSVNAVPAKPGIWKVLKLVDGSEVKAEFKGDEHCRYWQSADGNIYIKSSPKDLYELVDKSTLRSKARITNIHQKMMSSANSSLPESVLTGSHRGLIILVEYPDKNFWGNQKYAFQEEHTKEFYERITNTKTSLMSSKEGEELRKEYPGSVFDYFYTQSNGKFQIQFDVVGPYTLSHNREYYGSNYREEPVPDDPTGPRKMVLEACELADTDPKMDFTKYDWDNDGYIDLVFVLYSSVGEATAPDEEDAVWPHQGYVFSDYYYQNKLEIMDSPWTIDGEAHSLLFDGKRVFQYACASELEGKIGGSIGTICHEFSHCLGLMDHYVMNDPNANNDKAMFAFEYWDIMDMGSYNGNGKIPAGYNSFEKAFLGWLDPIEVGDGSERVRGLKPYSAGGDAYKLKNHANDNEYYLIENRQKTGWDAALPGSGVLITHMDYDEKKYKSNKINDGNDHLRFRVVPADNKDTKNSQEGDAYPYGNNDRLDEKSSPSNKVFNKNIDESYNLGYSIKNISVSEKGLASFDIISKLGNEANADVNRDNKVNAADIVIVSNVLAKGDDVDDETWRRSDADGNGERNADDIQFIVKTIMEEPGGSAGFIKFEDKNVKKLCIENWDKNGDGELSKEEAASVKNLNLVFNSKKDIISFNELQYFTGLSSIELSAFTYCENLTTISIPNSVKKIDKSAFYGCSNLTSITIPNSVTEIGFNVFENCTSLTTISIPNSVTKIGSSAFKKCSSLTSIIIPNSVTDMGLSTFEGCSSIATISIPNSVTEIGVYSFNGCYSLTSITIPDNVTNIESYAFQNCSGLTSVTIGNGLIHLGSTVFGNCSKLTDIYCSAENVPSIDSNVFWHFSIENATLHVPSALVNDYKAIKPWNNFGAIVGL